MVNEMTGYLDNLDKLGQRELSEYFRNLGRKGGKKSKRKLSSEEAKRMNGLRKVVKENGKKKVQTKRSRCTTVSRN